MDINSVCKAIQEQFIAKGKTLSTAESCTGGRIAALLTSVAGSSAYFRGGIVSYQTHIKSDVLHVSKDTIDRFGVVSKETATEMRICACKLFNSDCAISITGYAGPTGGTITDPVGTVYVSVGSASDGITRRIVSHEFLRTDIQDEVARAAIRLLYEWLEKTEI